MDILLQILDDICVDILTVCLSEQVEDPKANKNKKVKEKKKVQLFDKYRSYVEKSNKEIRDKRGATDETN